MPDKANLHSVEPFPGPQPQIRKARLSDVNDMFRMINHYAEKQLMLRKTQLQLYENLRDYSIAVEALLPIGCSGAALFTFIGKIWRKYGLSRLRRV